MTPLPVIGVPVKGSSLDGMDSLLSIVQVMEISRALAGWMLGNSSRWQFISSLMRGLCRCPEASRWQPLLSIMQVMRVFWQCASWQQATFDFSTGSSSSSTCVSCCDSALLCGTNWHSLLFCAIIFAFVFCGAELRSTKKIWKQWSWRRRASWRLMVGKLTSIQ